MEKKINEMDISEKTKTNYNYKLRNLISLGYDFDYTVDETEEFLNYVEIQKKLDFLTVIIVLSRDKDYSELRKRIQQEYSVYRDNKLDKLVLITPDEFVSRMNELYKKELYEPYVLNWLMYKFGTRNLDLQFTVGEKVNGNYLIKNNNSIICLLYTSPSPRD